MDNRFVLIFLLIVSTLLKVDSTFIGSDGGGLLAALMSKAGPTQVIKHVPVFHPVPVPVRVPVYHKVPVPVHHTKVIYVPTYGGGGGGGGADPLI